jgi:hypothetical protein
MSKLNVIALQDMVIVRKYFVILYIIIIVVSSNFVSLVTK